MSGPWYTSTLGRVLLIMFLSAFFVFGKLAHADVVEFSEEELSRESVLPIFDQPEAVKKRLVPTDHRIEVGGYAGMSLNNPWINEYPLGLDLEYHLSEEHALGANVSYFVTSQTSYVGQVQSQVKGGNFIPFNNNPTPVYWALAEYEFTPYYGKISITKQAVMNLNLGGTIRAGMIGFNSESSPAVSLGFNERLFFTRNFGLKLDLQGMVYQRTDIIPINPNKSVELNLFLTLGALWYFPAL